jgi:hypothetical protein
MMLFSIKNENQVLTRSGKFLHKGLRFNFNEEVSMWSIDLITFTEKDWVENNFKVFKENAFSAKVNPGTNKYERIEHFIKIYSQKEEIMLNEIRSDDFYKQKVEFYFKNKKPFEIIFEGEDDNLKVVNLYRGSGKTLYMVESENCKRSEGVITSTPETKIRTFTVLPKDINLRHHYDV